MNTACIALAAAVLLLAGCGGEPSAEEGRRQAVAEVRPDGPMVDNPFETDNASAGVEGAAGAATAVDETLGSSTAPESIPEEAETPVEVTPTTDTGRSCSDGKRVCGDMDSCEDAMFHLNQCGMSRLDGDSDGTPCEKICG